MITSFVILNYFYKISTIINLQLVYYANIPDELSLRKLCIAVYLRIAIS